MSSNVANVFVKEEFQAIIGLKYVRKIICLVHDDMRVLVTDVTSLDRCGETHLTVFVVNSECVEQNPYDSDATAL